jgi:hypothetical protein
MTWERVRQGTFGLILFYTILVLVTCGSFKPSLQASYSTTFATIAIVVTLLLEEWEDDIHIPKMGTWESIRTLETSKFDFKGQNTLH